MGVGAADAEGADGGHAHAAFGGGPLGGDVEGAAGVRPFVQGPEVRHGRDLAAVQDADGADEPGDARGGVEVADVGLHGAEGAGAAAAVEGRERGVFDRVAEFRSGAVGLDVADLVGVGRGVVERGPDHLLLAAHAGRGVPDFDAAVVVGGAAGDHGVDVVAVGQGPVERFEQDHPAALAAHGALGVLGEGAAHAVLAEDHALVPGVALLAGEVQRHASGERHVGLALAEALHGLVDGHEGGRARRLHVDGRAGQVELVGDLGGEEVLLVHGHRLERPDRVVLAAEEAGHPREVRAAAREQGDVAGVLAGRVPGVLQGVPGGLVEQPHLRVERLGLLGGVAEELGVELGGGDVAARVDVARVVDDGRVDAGGEEFVPGEPGDADGARGAVVPVLGDGRGAGEDAGHADDGDLASGVGGFGCGLGGPVGPVGGVGEGDGLGRGLGGRLRAEGCGERTGRGVLEEGHERHVGAQGLAEPVADEHELVGVAADVEEVVVRADGAAEDGLPGGEDLAEDVRGGRGRRGRFGCGGPLAAQRLPVDLVVVQLGHLVHAPQVLGVHVAGEGAGDLRPDRR